MGKAYSPRIFGKTGDEFIAMQTPDQGIAPPVDPSVVVPSDIPTPTLPGVTPYQDYINKQTAIESAIKTTPQYIAPERFAGTIPNPQVLPPPAAPDNKSVLQFLLRAYPFLSLFGGVRGANAVLPAAASGINTYQTNEYNQALQDRAIKQQALDAQFKRDVENMQLQADSNRYYNAAGSSFNLANNAQYKTDIGAKTALAKQASSELARQRRDTTQQIGQILTLLGHNNVSWDVAKYYMNIVDNLRAHLRDDLGGVNVTGMQDIANLSPDQAGWLDKIDELRQRHLNKEQELQEWGKIQLGIAKYVQGQYGARQQTELSFREKMHKLDIAKQQADETWRNFRERSLNERNTANNEVRLRQMDIDLAKYNQSALQKANYQDYLAKRDAYLAAQKQFNATQARIRAFYSDQAKAGRGYVPSPQAQSQLEQDEASVGALQDQVEALGRDAAAARGVLSLPPTPIKPPPHPATLGSQGPQPPQPPRYNRSDSGGSGEHGAGTRGIQQTRPKRSPISGNRVERSSSTTQNVNSIKTRVDNF